VHRSDRAEIVRRWLSVHIWVDPAKLEEGEIIAEMVRRVYANQGWCFDFGSRVTDVLDGGPPHAHQINEPTFAAWELVKLLTLCIQQPRVDTSCYEQPCGMEDCPAHSISSSNSGSVTTSGSSSR
jgi:hypothetical protein